MDEKKAGFLERMVSTLGFPIVMCGFLLYQQFTVLSKLSDSITQNSELIRQLTDKIGG
jgi:hypothetical protein